MAAPGGFGALLCVLDVYAMAPGLWALWALWALGPLGSLRSLDSLGSLGPGPWYLGSLGSLDPVLSSGPGLSALWARWARHVNNSSRNENTCLFIHISAPTRPLYISYALFCLKKKK